MLPPPPSPVWGPRPGDCAPRPLQRQRAGRSEQGDRHGDLSALIFGSWSDLLIGQWGGVDVIVDNATEAHKGNVRIAAHLEWDIAVRHAEAFGAIIDNETLA